MISCSAALLRDGVFAPIRYFYVCLEPKGRSKLKKTILRYLFNIIYRKAHAQKKRNKNEKEKKFTKQKENNPTSSSTSRGFHYYYY